MGCCRHNQHVARLQNRSSGSEELSTGESKDIALNTGPSPRRTCQQTKRPCDTCRRRPAVCCQHWCLNTAPCRWALFLPCQRMIALWALGIICWIYSTQQMCREAAARQICRAADNQTLTQQRTRSELTNSCVSAECADQVRAAGVGGSSGCGSAAGWQPSCMRALPVAADLRRNRPPVVLGPQLAGL
jgi:hypothetical protein